LRAQPPPPSDFGLNSETTRLQVLTEFYDAPPAQKRHIPATRRGVLQDETVDFGNMKIGPGKAFLIGESSQKNKPIRVSKEWTILEGRNFLVEEVPFKQVDERIQSTLRKRQGASVNPNRRGKGENVMAALRNVLPKRLALQEKRSTI